MLLAVFSSHGLTPVHINFWLNAIFVSGAATSGRRGVKGLIRSRKRTAGGLALKLFAQIREVLTAAHRDECVLGCNPYEEMEEKLQFVQWLPAEIALEGTMGRRGSERTDCCVVPLDPLNL